MKIYGLSLLLAFLLTAIVVSSSENKFIKKFKHTALFMIALMIAACGNDSNSSKSDTDSTVADSADDSEVGSDSTVADSDSATDEDSENSNDSEGGTDSKPVDTDTYVPDSDSSFMYDSDTGDSDSEVACVTGSRGCECNVNSTPGDSDGNMEPCIDDGITCHETLGTSACRKVCVESFEAFNQNAIDALIMTDCDVIDGDVYLNTKSKTSATIPDLPNLVEVTGSIELTDITNPNFNFISNIKSIGGYFYFSESASLTSLQGLGNLEEIGEGISIYDNAALTSLSGAEKLDSVGNDLVEIKYNCQLPASEVSDFDTTVSPAACAADCFPNKDEVGCDL